MSEQMKRKSNLKIFAIYKMFSWDLLFYYAIIFLFLTRTKGLSASQILFVDAFYPLFKIIFQVFGVTIIDSLGKQKSLLLANLLISGSILMLILGNGISALFISNIIMSLGYVLKENCDPNILNDSIPDSKNKSDIFTKIDGKGSSHYYYLDAISSVSTGFLFVVNSYLPMILCFVFSLIATLICLGFQDIDNSEDSKKSSFKKSSGFKYLKGYLKDLRYSFKHIFKSTRLKSLMLMSATMYSFLAVFGTLRSSLLVDLVIPEQYFGIILAVAQIISAISTKNQNWFHKTFKNKTLTWFSLPIAFSLIFTGIFIVCNFNIIVIYIMVAIMIAIISIIKGPYYTLISRYYNNFSDSSINTKIYASKSLVESIVRVPIYLLSSFLLGITSTAYTLIILGCILTVIFVLLLDYMKTRLGLKPEEYNKKDIEFKVLR